MFAFFVIFNHVCEWVNGEILISYNFFNVTIIVIRNRRYSIELKKNSIARLAL